MRDRFLLFIPNGIAALGIADGPRAPNARFPCLFNINALDISQRLLTATISSLEFEFSFKKLAVVIGHWIGSSIRHFSLHGIRPQYLLGHLVPFSFLVEAVCHLL